MFKKLNNKKGFTLMEMLIVVAIIAILVAIAIPTMTNALEQARESADAANIRSCYAEVMTLELTVGATSDDWVDVDNGVFTIENDDANGTITGKVKLTQQKTGWQNAKITNIAGTETSSSALSAVESGDTVFITYYETGTNAGSCLITIE